MTSPLSAFATQASGTLRRVISLMAVPLVPDDFTQLLNPLWSARELRGRIERITRLSDDVVTLAIKPGPGVDTDFEPGQYLGIGVLIDGRWTWRSYSLTSVPLSADGLFTVTVKAMPEGKLSSHLVDTVQAGTVIRLAAPAGDFHLPDPLPAQLLFITAGTGLTPVLGMLRTLARRCEIEGIAMPDIVHVHSVREKANSLFADELEAFAAAHPSYTLHWRITAHQGRFTVRDLPTLVPDWSARVAYACGPEAMLDNLEAHYAEHAAATATESLLRTERFTLSRESDAQGGDVTFAHSHKATIADGATTLLEAGESVGVAMPFGCRMGICQTCVVEIDDGYALNLRNGDVAGPGERVQACICVAKGDLTLSV